MKLYLAVATLLLVLAAHTEAQEDSGIEDHFANFGSKIMEFGEDLTQKTKDALKGIHESEFATKTRNWFTEQFEKMKQSFSKE